MCDSPIFVYNLHKLHRKNTEIVYNSIINKAAKVGDMVKEKILVIEDDLDIQEIVSEFLSAKEYEVKTASDGLEGLERFNNDKFDLVILDVMLPKIDGFVVCEIIRKSSNVPIIMLTALEEEEDQLKGFELKADDYITKPFSMNILVKRVEAVLRRNSALQ